MPKLPLVLYHFPCAANDGFAGAYAAWRKYGEAAEYVPARPGTPPACDYADRDVFMVDVSYSVAHLDAIRAVARSLTILDHHEDAEAVLRDYPGAIFDLSRSGATIAWAHFHPEVPVPQLLLHIEDRDRYVFLLEDTKDVLALVDTLPYDFESWHQIATADEAQWQTAVSVGRAMRTCRVHQSGLVSKEHIVKPFLGAPAKIVNAPYALVNDVADHLLAGYEGIAVLWCVEQDMLRISLRANKHTINVQKVIAQLGGGGHASAAAVRVPLGMPTAKAPAGHQLIADFLT